MSFAETFALAVGSSPGSDATPYEYQVRAAEALLAGRDVLLSAPTGAGKTLAALLPYLHARRTGIVFADRVLYALPLRALAHRLAADTAASLATGFPDVKVAIQTGAQPDDDLLRGDIVFTTIDQLLSAYLTLPLSLSRRLGNINAGALVGSLVVFDETHLLEPAVALSTLTHLRRALRNRCRLVLATATLGRPSRKKLREELDLVEVTPAPQETASMPALAHRHRTWVRRDGPLTARAVRDVHRAGRTLVVLNSVRQAQEVARDLLSSPPAGAEVLVLHSRFLPGDRAAAEATLAERLGPQSAACNVIVVATQVVEAGIDCSADLLLTEIAPANALVQRAGRCGRYRPPRNRGEVIVHDARRDRGPYADVRACVDGAWDRLPVEPTRWSGDDEADFVDRSLGHHEAALLDREVFSQSARRTTDEQIHAAWCDGDIRSLAERVRNVRSATVFVTANPDRDVVLTERPVGFSLPWTVWTSFVRSVGRERILGALDDDEAVADRVWTPLTGEQEPRPAFAVPPSLARYGAVGLELGEPSTAAGPPIPHRGATSWTRPRYRAETYRDHVRRVVVAARSHLQRSAAGVAVLAAHHGIAPTVLRNVVLATAALHDVGKLSRRCQEDVAAYQAARHKRVPEPLAHTDYDPIADAGAKSPFGPHALEGAMAVADLVGALIAGAGASPGAVQTLTTAAISAIARHHAPRGTRSGEFELIDGVEALVLESSSETLRLPSEAIGLMKEARETDLSDCLLDPRGRSDHRDMVPLYWFLVRLVRLSDQEGTAAGASEENAT